MIKVLASDFDNTLYVNDYEIFKKNIDYVNKFREVGNLFIIITGRPLNSIKPLLDKYLIKVDYLICDNGAEIYDEEYKILNKICIDKDDILKIKDIALKNNLTYTVDLETTNIINDYDIGSVFIYRNAQLTIDVINEIKNTTNTYSYLSPSFLNIVNKRINKLNSLKILEEKLGNINMYTIGDAINDIEMINYYNGAKMKNHEEFLDKLDVEEYECFYEYVEKILKIK